MDVVEHSMGGLVARAYEGTQKFTQLLRGRDLGETIHQIITLDTPEEGSALATFLFDHKDDHYKCLDCIEAQLAWVLVLNVPNVLLPLKTAAEFFDNLNMNVTNGAVASLVPGSTNLQKLPAPNAPKWIWNAIGAVVPQPPWIVVGKSALEAVIEDVLIAGISLSHRTAPTIFDILQDDGQDDAIVTFASQTSTAKQGFKFPNLAHTSVGHAASLSLFGGYYTQTHWKSERLLVMRRFLDSSGGHDSRRLPVT